MISRNSVYFATFLEIVPLMVLQITYMELNGWFPLGTVVV